MSDDIWFIANSNCYSEFPVNRCCAGGAAVSQTRTSRNTEAPQQEGQATAIYHVQAEFESLIILLSILY